MKCQLLINKKNKSLLRQSRDSALNVYKTTQSSHRLEKYLNLEGFLEKFLKINYALKSAGKSLKSLKKSLNSTIFCRT